MRVSGHCAAAVLLTAVFAGQYAGTSAQAPGGKGDAAAVLVAARQALGGENKLTAVKTVTATGRTRQVRGENLVPIEFEIFIELPDKYVRKDEIPAQETGVTAAGFSGDELIQDPPPPPAPAPQAGAAGPGPRPNMPAARVNTLKQDFTRLALGMFAASFPSYPLTFTYVAEAEAPQGKADVLEGKGPNNFTIRLFISRDTHLPLMVSWIPPPPPMRGGAPPGAGRGAEGGRGQAGGPPPAAAAPGAVPPPAPAASSAPPSTGAPAAGVPAARGGPPGAPPENRLYFADYRDVDGLQLPFRLRRAVGADTIEETIFDRYKLNSKIDPRRFEVRK